MASNVKVNKITPTSACGTVTLGDSGDTISIPSGASLSVGGTVSGIEGIISWDTTAKTTGFTAVAGTGYFVNTTSAAITVTLPASPTAGDLVAVKDYAFTADTNNITLARNGSNIQGTANDFVISTEGRSVTLIYVDGTQGWLLTGASQKSDIAQAPVFITATGGTVTTCGNYKIHTFTSPGTFCVSTVGNPTGSNTVDYMVVAGGGGGGGNNSASSIGGGGGGAGGYRESSGTASGCYTRSPLGACVSALPVSVTGYPVTVGAGGAGGTGTPSGANNASSGSNSIFSTITSAGGGKGAGRSSPDIPTANAFDGGSGGGMSGNAPAQPTGGAGNTPPVSPPQGNAGGSANPCGNAYGSGGGGGATVAANSVGSPGYNPTTGGAGATSSINGTPTARAGGGGGGGANAAASPLTTSNSGSPGGAGGGGAGGNTNPTSSGTSGTTNTGGGGGGAGAGLPTCTVANGGSGGSGIVIIRYKYQ